MNYAPCTCLPESEEDYLPTSSSDTGRLLPLSGTNTLAESCANEQQTDGSLNCQCGKGTLDCSIHPNTREEWIASMQGSLAKILVSLENRPDLERALGQGFTAKSCESLAWYDRDTCSWKTYQRSFLTDWGAYSETWPRWGMTADGSAFAHPMSALRMGAIDGLPLQLGTPTESMSKRSESFAKGRIPSPAEFVARETFATPNTLDSLPPKSPEALQREMMVTRPGRSKPSNLRDQVSNMQNWPTPRAGNPGSRPNGKGGKILAAEVTKLEQNGGQLSPKWVAWLMGFPIEWALSRD